MISDALDLYFWMVKVDKQSKLQTCSLQLVNTLSQVDFV
jgi:hypothetical protein